MPPRFCANKRKVKRNLIPLIVPLRNFFPNMVGSNTRLLFRLFHVRIVIHQILRDPEIIPRHTVSLHVSLQVIHLVHIRVIVHRSLLVRLHLASCGDRYFIDPVFHSLSFLVFSPSQAANLRPQFVHPPPKNLILQTHHARLHRIHLLQRLPPLLFHIEDALALFLYWAAVCGRVGVVGKAGKVLIADCEDLCAEGMEGDIAVEVVGQGCMYECSGRYGGSAGVGGWSNEVCRKLRRLRALKQKERNVGSR